ncbi:MAG: carboxypeptidase regulatory-like domain-containing protein, partial [Candidatus Omnitrophica bacterium]|nr:carboxypeptidase regulatory-like domain-containing protein [Candidatus Omnitrophota bacterium]
SSRGVHVEIEGLPPFGVYELDRLVFRPGYSDAELYQITIKAFPKGEEDRVTTESFWVEVMPAGRYAVSGHIVTADGRGIKDVSMRVDKRVVYTDERGYFKLDRLIEGTYSFEPRRAGFVFDPERVVVEVKDKNVRGIDFSGHMAAYLKITTPEWGVYVKEAVIARVEGIGSVRLPDRVTVNGVDAFFDSDVFDPSNVNSSYTFVVDKVPLAFNADGSAYIDVVAYNEFGHVLARDRTIVHRAD